MQANLRKADKPSANGNQTLGNDTVNIQGQGSVLAKCLPFHVLDECCCRLKARLRKASSFDQI